MNTGTMTDAVANEYVSLCRQGKFEEAIERFFAANHVRLESLDMAGPPIEIRGIDAVKANMQAPSDESEIHGVEIDGPFVRQDRFVVRFAIDTTFKQTGQRTTITKMDLYTVEGGKIVRDEVYYNTPPGPAVSGGRAT